MVCIFVQHDRGVGLLTSPGSLNVYCQQTKERLANQVSHTPLKLAAGRLAEGEFLEPAEFNRSSAGQVSARPVTSGV